MGGDRLGLGERLGRRRLVELAGRHPHFIVDKEAMPYVSQLVEIKRQLGDRLNIMCCDYPKYSIVLPTLALGGSGTANIGGNIIPEAAALYSRPWTSQQIMEECREGYFKWYPLLQELYALSNPVVIKAALNILGLPGGHLRRPYLDYEGPRYEVLRALMVEMGVVAKYGV